LKLTSRQNRAGAKKMTQNKTPSFAPNITFRGPSALYVGWS
jgi:hypothetical protein